MKLSWSFTKMNLNSLCQFVSNKDGIFIEFFILISSCHFYKKKCNIRHWDPDTHTPSNFKTVCFQFFWGIFWCIEENGRKSFGNCLQNNPIKLNNSWMLQRFIQGHNERKISDRLKYQKESLLFSFNKGNWLLLLCDFVGNCLQFQFFFHLSTFIHFQIPTSNRDLQAVICHLYDSHIDYNALWQNNPSEIIFVQSEVFNAVKKDFKERLT